MEQILYSPKLFIDRILKTKTEIRWIGFGCFIVYADDGNWIAIVRGEDKQSVIDYLNINNVQI